MGSLLDTPKTNKESSSGSGLNLRYGISAMQGWRMEMEDNHCAQIILPDERMQEWSFFAVFDGHAGSGASEMSSKQLLNGILKDENLIAFLEDKLLNVPECDEKVKNPAIEEEEEDDSDSAASEIDISRLRDGYVLPEYETKKTLVVDRSKDPKPQSSETFSSSADESEESQEENSDLTTGSTINKEKTTSEQEGMNSGASIGQSDKKKSGKKPFHPNEKIPPTPEEVKMTAELRQIREGIRRGFVTFDKSLRESMKDNSGTTAVCAFVTPSHYIFANCGDSRAILCKGQQQIFSTYDHKPYDEKERTRIENAGGKVMLQRVNGSLAVSRALGDFDYKSNENFLPHKQLVSPVPDVVTLPRTGETFMILACDGIWDVMTNQDVCNFIDYMLRVEENIETICSSLIDVSLYRGSKDNMSVLVVALDDSVKPTPEAKAQEQEDMKFMEREINVSLAADPTLTIRDMILAISEAFNETKSDHIIPLGAGIESKRTFITQRMEEWHFNNSVLK